MTEPTVQQLLAQAQAFDIGNPYAQQPAPSALSITPMGNAALLTLRAGPGTLTAAVDKPTLTKWIEVLTNARDHLTTLILPDMKIPAGVTAPINGQGG